MRYESWKNGRGDNDKNVKFKRGEMIFPDVYQLDKELDLPRPQLTEFDGVEPHLESIKSGAYNSGLIQVCDKDNYGAHTLKSWSHLVGGHAVPLAFCGWGDFVCASFDDEQFYLVLVQENHVVKLGNLIKGVFDINLPDSGFMTELLWSEKFQELTRRKGSLTYGECFIHQPWLCLGAEENFENYTKGDISVYIDLVGQHWQKQI